MRFSGFESRPPPPTRAHPQVLAQGAALKPADFFSLHPVFRVEDFMAEQHGAGRSAHAVKSTLRYHCRTGRLLHLRRGLYAHALGGTPDPWLVASKLTPDAVIGYQGALSFWGLTGWGHSTAVLSESTVRHFVFADIVYTAVPPGPIGGGIELRELQGHRVYVTTLERTFVELLARLDLSPPPVELFELFVQQRSLELREMARFASLLRNGTARGRVALFLANHPGFARSGLAGEDLLRLAPATRRYFDRNRRTGDELLVHRCNLLVSAELRRAFDAALR